MPHMCVNAWPGPEGVLAEYAVQDSQFRASVWHENQPNVGHESILAAAAESSNVDSQTHAWWRQPGAPSWSQESVPSRTMLLGPMRTIQATHMWLSFWDLLAPEMAKADKLMAQ